MLLSRLVFFLIRLSNSSDTDSVVLLLQRLLDEIEVAEDTSKPVEHKPSSTTRVLADGTYATETVYSSTVHEKEKIAKIRAAAKAPLRGLSRLPLPFLEGRVCSLKRFLLQLSSSLETSILDRSSLRA